MTAVEALNSVGSILVIEPLDSGNEAFRLVNYSARALNQTLVPIASVGGSIMGTLIRRTISGKLINMLPATFNLYSTTISCRDLYTPCLDNAWLGASVRISCVTELSVPIGVEPQRPIVEHSERYDGHFMWYRPILNCMITAINSQIAEWDAEYQWSIEAEEIGPVVVHP